MSTTPIVQSVPIRVGDTVRVTDKKFRLDGHQGQVIDLESYKFGGSLGPIAVFFDKEVPPELLINESGARDWDTSDRETPTLENYMDCPRIVCFHPQTLTVIPT